MWIFLSIVAFLVIIITVILLLPVRIIIKNDENGELILLYKILFKTFGEDPDPNHPVVKALKKSTGVDNLELAKLREQVKQKGLKETVSQTLRILLDLIKEFVGLLKYCKAEKFEFKVVCTGDDAAETAINYGECCAVAYPILGLIGSVLKIKKRGCDVDIRCDYNGKPQIVRYNFVLKVSLYRAIAALWRISLKEAKRQAAKQQYQRR